MYGTTVPSYPPATRTSPLRSLVAVKNARALFIGFAGVQVIACPQAAGAKVVAAAVRIIAAARRRHFLAPIPVFSSSRTFCWFMIFLISFCCFRPSSTLVIEKSFLAIAAVQPEIRREVTGKMQKKLRTADAH